jgi:WD40 repeat protein
LVKTLEGEKPFAITPDGKLLASRGRVKRENIELWRLPDGTMKTLEGHKDTLTSIAISPDGKLLASGSADKTIRLWRLPDGHPLATLKAYDHAVGVVAIDPGGKLLASGDWAGSILLWSLPDGKRLGCLIDLAASSKDVKGSTYTVKNAVTGQTVTYTLPCGSPIPSGASCACNCVPGSLCQCVGFVGGGGQGGGGRCLCMAVRCR